MAFLFVLVSGSAWSQDNTLVDFSLGLESDSNARRVEGTEVAGDTLTRYFLQVQHREAVGSGQTVGFSLRSGGKLYDSTKEEDALLHQASMTYGLLPLLAWGHRWLFVQARANVKDRTERGNQRDYLRLSSSGSLGVSWEGVSLVGGTGYSVFHYKPNPKSSNHGLLLDLALRWNLNDTWVFHGSVSRSVRDFESDRRQSEPGGSVVLVEGDLRRDTSLVYTGGASYQGFWVVGASLSYLRNRSDSYGQAFQRYGATLTASVPLPWSFFAHLRASLFRIHFEDEVYLDESLALDEENRNTFIVELERPLYGRLYGTARYSMFLQESGVSEADYQRRLFFLGLGVEY